MRFVILVTPIEENLETFEIWTESFKDAVHWTCFYLPTAKRIALFDSAKDDLCLFKAFEQAWALRAGAGKEVDIICLEIWG